MASVNASVADRNDWPFSNPWLWLAFGTSSTLWSLLWTRFFGAQASDSRVIVLALGLLCTAIGVQLRWNDRQTAYFQAFSKPLAGGVRLALGVSCALVALGMTILLGLSFYLADRIGWKPGGTFLVWLTIAPSSWFAAARCLQAGSRHAGLDALEESSLSLLLAALVCFLGSLTLSLGGEYATDWDTLRMFLRVLMALCLFAAALILVSVRLRRLVLSLVIVLHFAGISSAVLATPPSPWMMHQLWTRIFRPYLEFMYLNNAYHYYAPEPGPTSYLWFRLIYEAPDGGTYGWWYKVPQIDNEEGAAGHSFRLDLQRFVAMTESLGAYDPPPPYANEQGHVNPVYLNRMQMVPGFADIRVGQGNAADKAEEFRIPLDPNFQPLPVQFMRPNSATRRLLGSNIRFVARKFATRPDEPSWTFRSVKVYRVIHLISQPAWLNNGLSPADPALYRPFYLGNYDAEGNLLDGNSPYLYWLLPILRVNPNDPDAKIRDFARLHAGDPNWVRPPLQPAQHNKPPPWGLPDEEDRKLVKP